ncbi:MAG: Tyrosine--tRNA ligase [Alphaproteobacteria bacterium MarineAlpha9_Bin4]|nr:MAG: Tyrosine--tRNA ligase [Alphaproteobacteria bacterium MarineAlpha9_Bin4]
MKNNIKDFLEILTSRGFIHQTTDLEELKSKFSTIVGYTGFDCTADCLHVGSLLQLMLLKWLQNTNNKPIVLIGGGTTKIGDPSGKDETRKILDDNTINSNTLGIREVILKFIKFNNSGNGGILVNNAEWLDNIKYIEFLRNFGRHFSVNRMLAFDSVKTRLERKQNLSFLEFNYMITQAYDYYYLNKEYGCNVQFGGSDQWGNIVSGIDLIKRTSLISKKNINVHAITSPLITTSTGQKMGKTSKGAIWLSEKYVSVFDFWQFWRNTTDEDVIKFLKLFTEIELSEINKLEKLKGEELNYVKIMLANSVTETVHGYEKTIQAEKSSKSFLDHTLNDNDSLPKVNLELNLLEEGIPIYKIFSLEKILCKSNSDARRLIQQGGAKLNGKKISNYNYIINKQDIQENNLIFISAGVKRHAVIKII